MSSNSVVFVASDHAGFELKEYLKKALVEVAWTDCGPPNANRVDYPDFADKLVDQVLRAKGRGVLICGSGQGMAMRANRYPGVRAALVWDETSARLSREHNDSNVVCLGARLLTEEVAQKAVRAFLTTSFEGGRHNDRVAKLEGPLINSCRSK